MQNRRSTTGRARIIFDNRTRLMYNYCTYRKSETRTTLYNVTFSMKNAHDVAKNVSYLYHRDGVIPNYKIIDEKDNVLMDSRFESLQGFMDY